MISMTTSSSMRVKPRAARRGELPVMVVDFVQPHAMVERVHVVDIVPRLRIVGRARVAAQPPGLLRGHFAVREERVAGHAAHEVEHRLVRAGGVLDPGVERLEVRRVARRSELLVDVPGVGGHLVRIERGADIPERRAQLHLFLALGDELCERHGRGRHESYDRERDDQLDEGEAAVAHGSHVGGGAHCDAGWIAILSGGAVLLPTAAPVPPKTFSMAMIVAGVAGTDVAGRPCCPSAALSAAAAAIAVGLDGATTAAPAAPLPGAASGAGGAPGAGAVPAGAGETLGALPEGAVPSGVPALGAAAGWLSPPAPAP